MFFKTHYQEKIPHTEEGIHKTYIQRKTCIQNSPKNNDKKEKTKKVGEKLEYVLPTQIHKYSNSPRADEDVFRTISHIGNAN